MHATSNTTQLAATKTLAQTRTTPHRVMRELYEQFIIYERAFAEGIDANYLPRVAAFGATTESAFNALTSIRSTVYSGAAAARSALVSPPEAPSHPGPPQDLAHPQRFITTPT